MMKQWKRMVLLGMLMALFGTGSAWAAERTSDETRVWDMADLFDEKEEAALAEEIDRLQEKMEMGLAIVTTEDNTDSARTYADTFYERYEVGFGKDHDGALLLIDMANGELWISTEGKMIRYLTDDRIDTLLDEAIEPVYDGDFYGSAGVFLTELETFWEAGIVSDQYNYDTETGKIDRYRSIQWYEFLIALAVAASAAGGAVLAVIREYGMKHEAERMSANFNLSYRKDSTFSLGNALEDVLLNSYVTHTVIRTQNNSPSRGGGGHASSGRSSTHRSSSGRSHGGGGRKFR